MRSWSEETEQTVSASHWCQWRCTRLTWPQTLATSPVALRWTRYQIPPEALIKAVFPGSSQTLSKVHILPLQQRRGHSHTGICSCLFIFGKGEMAAQSGFSSTRGKELLCACHNCRTSPTPGFLHWILKASCNTQSKTTLKGTLHISLEEVNVSKATYSIYTAPPSLVPAPHNRYFCLQHFRN